MRVRRNTMRVRKNISRRSKRKRSKTLKRSKALKRSNKVIIPIKKGLLSKYGYTSKKSTTARRLALKRAVKKYGNLSLFRKLNAIYVLQKNRNPRTAQIFKKDRNWVKKHYLSK